MSEVVTVSKEELERQEERIKRLARDKANVQLVVNLITSLTAVEGLDNTIEAMLRAVLEHVGGTNLSIHYRIDDDLYYADILGARRRLEAVEDPLVQRVFETRAFLERQHDFNDTKMLTPEFTSASTWVFPLVVGEDLLGAFKIENMHMQAQDLHAYLPTFFSHAALILRNAILGHTRLQKAYVQLEEEVKVRRQAERELREAKAGLEETVAARTAELQRVNRLYNVLTHVNQATFRSNSPETFLSDVCRIVVEHGQFHLSWIGHVDWETQEVIPIACAGPAIDYVSQLKLSLRDSMEGWGPARHAVRQANASVRNNVLADSTASAWRDAVLKAGFEAEIAVPIVRAGRVEGVLTIYSAEAEVFHAPEIALLEEIAADIAMALDRIHSEAMRAQAEEALRAKTEELDRYFTNALDLLCIADTDGYFHRLNPEWSTSLGYPISELEGGRFLDLVHPDDLEATLQAMALLADQKELLSFTNRYRHKDGSYRWIEWRSFPSGKYIYSVARDTTERKRAEQRLHEKERHSQSLLRLSRRLELAQTFTEVVDAARDEVREIIGYRSLWVFLFAEDKKHAYALVAGGTMSEAVMSEAGAATLTIEGDRMLEEIAEAKGIVVVEDARTDPRTNKEMVARLENRTIVNVPILFMDRHLGSVGTGTFGDEGVHPPTQSEEEYLSALSSHMAVTLDRLHLLTERKRAEQERLAHLRFFENLDKINRAIQGTRDLDSMMNSLLGEVLSVFDCDRAWLFHPCDPDAPVFRVPMEVTKPECPGAKMLNVDIPMPPEMAQNLREALESDGPVTYAAGTERPVNNVSAEVFGVQSQMLIAVYPKSGKPWAFGIHQCSHPRVWTPEEERFFLEISWRLADSLTSLLAHRDLRQSERHLRTLVENIPDCISRFDENCRRILVNPAVVKTLGIPAGDLIGKTMSESGVPGGPANRAHFEEVIRKTFREGPQSLEAEWITCNGIRTFEVLSVPEKDENGKTVTVLGIAHDITERKESEEALRRLNRELQAISSCNQVLMRAVDEQTLLADVCRIICDEAGYRFTWVGYAEHDEAKTIRPVSWAGVEDGYLAEARLSWADTERGRGPSGKTIRSGKSHTIQDFDTDPEVLLWRDNALKRGYRSSIALPLKDEEGRTFGSLQIYSTKTNVFTEPEIKLLDQLAADLAFGITALRTRAERRRAEEALQEERRLFIGGPNVAFVWRAVEGWPVEYVSPNVVEQFGYTPEDFTGGKVSYAGIVHPDDLARIAEEGKVAGESGVPCFDQEYRIARADGEYRWVYDFTVFTRDSGGKVTHFRGHISDITARKRLEDIRQARIHLLEFAGSHSVDELLTATLDRIEAITGSYIGFYHFVEDDQETVSLQNWSTNTLEGMCRADGKGIHYAISQAGVWSDCVHQRGPVIHNDFASLPHRKGMPEGHVPVQREVVVPVFRGGLIKAIVGVGNKFTDYSEHDVETVSQLADLSWDIVERKRTQEKIRQTAEEWQTTFDSISDMVSIQDTEFNLVRVNKAYADTLGSTCDALTGRKCHEVIHGANCPIPNCPHVRTLAHGEAFVEELFEPSLGVYLEASTSPIFNEAGEVTGSIHIAKDITARKQAEDTLRRSELEKSILNEIANVFLTISDEDMYEGVLAVVQRAIRSPFGIFGYVSEDGDLVLPSLSRGIWDQCQVPGKCAVFPSSSWGDSLWGKAMRDKKTYRSQGPFHTPEGHVCVESFLTAPIVYGNEAIGQIALANKDGGYLDEDQDLLERIAAYISPILNARLQRDREEQTRRAAQEEIRRLNAELEQRVRDRTLELESANKELESFSYSVSHDLRAPLRHVTGFVSLLNKQASDTLDEKSRHYLTVISESAIQMGKLIDDVLSFSRMGRAEIVKTPVSLQDLLTEVLQMVAHDIEGREITWLGDRLPDVYGSREMLRIVMTNLISNALKFTSQKPSAIIELGQIPDDAEDIVFIRDNGAGFDMQYADKLFGLFQRLHSTEEFEGTGLGLANVRRIVRRHGGRTWAEGVPGEGATFYFSLPKVQEK